VVARDEKCEHADPAKNLNSLHKLIAWREPGLVLRYDVKTHRPIGATVIDFKEYWASKRERLIDALSNFFHVSSGEVSQVIRRIH